MTYHEDIENRFAASLEKDKGTFAKPWLVSWAYQDKKTKLGLSYSSNLPQDFFGYNGPSDLLRWFDWIKRDKTVDYFDDDQVLPLVELSRAYDERITRSHSLSFDTADYTDTIGRYNAQDFLFQNFYPVPARYAVRRVLDFGAGYGRQANIWTQKHGDLVWVAMDAIPLSYCLQHLYYSQLPAPLKDYVIDPSSFDIGASPGIYHLPTWRHDLLPDSFFDMITCVQVLQEIDAKLLRFMLGVFHRTLKPGGFVYIRDHDLFWQPAHRLDLNRIMPRMGFELEFRPHVRNMDDIHGVPRIWRKQDPAVIEVRHPSTRSRVTQRIIDIDLRLGGGLTRVFKLLKKWKQARRQREA